MSRYFTGTIPAPGTIQPALNRAEYCTVVVCTFRQAIGANNFVVLLVYVGASSGPHAKYIMKKKNALQL